MEKNERPAAGESRGAAQPRGSWRWPKKPLPPQTRSSLKLSRLSPVIKSKPVALMFQVLNKYVLEEENFQVLL